MGGILGVLGGGMAHILVQANWTALEREVESIAGTLHDSLEPILPPSENLTNVLQQIFPDLCRANLPCEPNPSLIQRHTIGISDRSTYYIRVFDDQGNLLAFSPNQPTQLTTTLDLTLWQTLETTRGTRYLQFTTLLHSTHTHLDSGIHHPVQSWGYLQVGRTLAAFDAETQRIQWILLAGLPLALGLIAVSSWWLSGLAMQPIYQSYQQQQQFTADAAHELRSPLASLLATVEALLRLPVKPQEQEPMTALLQSIERQGRRLSQLVNDLLLLTSLEQGTALKPPKPCCLNDIITDLTEELAELAVATDINLQSQVPDNPVHIVGYESKLYRLVSNLMTNAIQYTPPSGSVVVCLVAQERSATITFQDTGIGIPAEEQSRIFERFYRVNSDRSRKTGGTGLGLAIAQAIIQLHQGHLTLHSEVAQGSVFTVYLPISLALG
jgi:two-component Ni(II)/redox sensor kinase NrsS